MAASKPKKKPTSAKLRGNATLSGMVLERNRLLEKCGLDHFLIRLPHLKLHTHFYYKLVESRRFDMVGHAHWHWEITKIARGRAAYTLYEYADSVEPDPNAYVIIPPKIDHEWKLITGPLLLNSWMLTIEPEDSDGEQVLNRLRNQVIAAHFNVPGSSEQLQAETLLWQMSANPYAPPVFNGILCGFARIILGDLLAALNPWPDPLLAEADDPHVPMTRLAEHVKLFLDANLDNPAPLNDLESHFHYSRRQLDRIFRKLHRQSISHYLREQRFELAKRWLETTDRTIKEIALSLGYKDSGQFCRYFHQQNGCTPSQYRQHSVSSHHTNIEGSVEHVPRTG